MFAERGFYCAYCCLINTSFGVFYWSSLGQWAKRRGCLGDAFCYSYGGALLLAIVLAYVITGAIIL